MPTNAEPGIITPLYCFTQEKVLRKYRSKPAGLRNADAKERIKEHGYNQLKKKTSWRWIKLLWEQFNNPLVWILLTAAALACAFQEYRDVTIILMIVIVNAAMGFFQEFKAERIIAKIQRLTTDNAIVIRDGEKKEVNAKELVPGDIAIVASGDRIPADGYLLESYDLFINDFIFTGESHPHKKAAGVLEKDHLAIGEITNMVYMGSEVTRGEGVFVVTGTGMKTELGRIARLSGSIHSDETPLQKRMRVLGREVAIVSVLIGIAVIIIGRFNDISWYQNFLFALALSVSVVPEGLPAALSVALSLGMKRLLKSHVLAKKLATVETLGSVSVIATDKTGTITRNELMVTRVVLPDHIFEVDGEGFIPKGNFYLNGKKTDPRQFQGLERIFKIGALCNDASLIKEDGHYKVIGDPTEGAIVTAARKYDAGYSRFFSEEQKTNEVPFSSDRMRMSVIYKNNETNSYVKGSPDVLLGLCTQISINNEMRPITEDDKRQIAALHNEMSQQALRVLAFAQRNLSAASEKDLAAEAERNLTWIGMMGMIDPPRKDIDAAVKSCRRAGIKVIMITGDYELTAEAIALQVGLIDKSKPYAVINGKILGTMSDQEIHGVIESKDAIFARISPEQKLRIATVLKNAGAVIAMTGDGVNDALALKKADIGIAMGVIGTDVAKEAGDMILMDDNFSSIVRGVKEGRIIFQNVKKFVHYVFTSNASELFTVVLGVLMQIPAPIAAIQILAVDLGTDVLPSFSLGVDQADPQTMNKKPFGPKEKIVTKEGFIRLVYLGIIMACFAVAAFVWSMLRGGWEWRAPIDYESALYIKSTSAAYAVLAISQMANLLQSRHDRLSVFTIGFFGNLYAIASIILSVVVFLLFLYLPFFQLHLHFLPIDKHDWLMVVIATVSVFFLEEARKKIIRD